MVSLRSFRMKTDAHGAYPGMAMEEMEDKMNVLPKQSTPLLPGLMVSLLVLLSLMAPVAFAQNNLSAFVDRTEVTVNDVLTLTIRVGAILGSTRPSLDGLNQDFDQLGTTTSSSYSNINGNVQSWTEYRVSLKPKSTGTLTIPSFRVGGETTQPITVNVREATELSGTADSDIFLVTTASKDSVYVQEQLLFTIKLYYSLRFDQGAQLSTPQVENSVVQQLGSDQSYQEIVEGIRYDVTERRYVIFPQSSGELVIPPIYFSATVGGRNGLNRLLNRSSPSRQINLASDAHEITVKGIPDSFTGQTWLPAADLELSEEWAGDTDNASVGDSLTRNIRMRAKGLSSSLLPPIEYQEVPGLRFYPDQPVREDSASNDGVTGSRTEGAAIVPSMTGEFTLPEIRIPWWNTETDRQEMARIPSRTLAVSGPQPGSSTMQIPATTTPFGGMDSTEESDIGEAGGAGSSNTLWVGTTLLFAAAWIFSTFMWVRNRQAAGTDGQIMSVLEAQVSEPDQNLPDLGKAFKYFVKSCEKENLEDIRRAVLSWGQAFYGNRNIRTLDQLKRYTNNPTVDALLFSLEKALYRPADAEGEEKFRSMQLLKEITSLHKQGPRYADSKAKQEDNLPPLYKN